VDSAIGWMELDVTISVRLRMDTTVPYLSVWLKPFAALL
jgi:hypothetical protein